MKLEATDQTLKTGTYTLSKDMGVKEIVKRFNEGAKAKTFRITFLPGGTMTAVRGRLLEAGYKAEEIDAAFKKQYDHPLLKSKPASASLEGYVYGDTYEFYASASVEDVLVRTFDEMYQASIQFICLAMTEDYIDKHYNDIIKHESDIESRMIEADCTKEELKQCNRWFIEMFAQAGEKLVIITEDFEEVIAGLS